MDTTTITSWMSEISESVRAERDHLVALDSAIGDGDHGTNMARGFDAVVKAAETQPEIVPGKMLLYCGRTLVSTVGGASGPLWGSALKAAGRSLGDRPNFGADELADALAAALAAIQDLGAASPGDKTMVDALDPAVVSLRGALASGKGLDEALEAAGDAAEEGMRRTVPMLARKGRASYLGERSIGHQDPGATSTALVIRALGRAVDQHV